MARRVTTNELIEALVMGLALVDRGRADRRFFRKLASGAGVSLALVLLLMEPRADVGSAAARPMFWMEVVFLAGMALIATTALHRLGYPGMRLGWLAGAAALPMAAAGLTAAVTLLSPAGARLQLPGDCWLECLAGTGFLSVPALGLALWASRELAATRQALAGAAAGLFAGAVAAFFVAFSCPEAQAPYLLVCSLPGMSLPVTVGTLLGPRVLRW